MNEEVASGREIEPFSEKSFYLAEFRGRTIAVAVPAEELHAPDPLERVLAELAANLTPVVVISSEPRVFESLAQTPFLAADAPRLEGAVWRGLRGARRFGVCSDGADAFARSCGEIALRLGVTKLVWIDREGGLTDAAGRRLSFVDLEEFRAILREPPPMDARRKAILLEVESVLTSGLAAVNLCSLAGLSDELFTYTGSGTLFSRERYVVVRSLGIDDFDAADHLIARGVAEGYLAPRSSEEIERVLTGGFGAFVEGRHLAGIGSLLFWDEAPGAEIASLYTLTRFVGEGIGAQLVAYACERARERGCRFVAAVTTSDRVAGFFERCGFGRVSRDAIPPEKWCEYDPARRERTVCLRREL